MLKNVFFLIIILLIVSACSKKASDPCDGKNPQLSIGNSQAILFVSKLLIAMILIIKIKKI